MTAALTGWLALRPARERWLLLACAALLAGLALQALVWRPMLAQRDALTDRLARLDLAAAVLARAPVQGAAPAPGAGPLNVVLTETAGAFALVIRRLEPEGDRMRLVLEDAPFDRVLLWLEVLQRERGLVLASAELTRRPAPGVVSVSLVVGR